MLAILTTHPIQYQIPIWRLLAQRGRVPFRVYYLSDHGLRRSYDADFGRVLAWDIDLTSGYDFEFVDAAAATRQSSFWWLRLNGNLGRQLKAAGAEVVWLQGWQVAAYWQALWQARAAGLSTWLRGESNLRSSQGGWRRALRNLALGQFLKRVDEFLCIGHANREFYLARKVHWSRLHSAPYCVENARFARQAEDRRSERTRIRARWMIPTDAACILFAGKMSRKKRPLDLIQAAELLTVQNPNRSIHLLFVGTGELGDAARARCHIAYDFENRTTKECPGAASRVSGSFVGFLNQSAMAEAYVAADCLALPSEATETWGLVVNEAMACGIPAVVSSEAGCCDDLVRPVRPDLCFPVGDIQAFSQALRSCLDRPPSAAGLRALVDRYDIRHTVETLERLYEARRPGIADRISTAV